LTCCDRSRIPDRRRTLHIDRGSDSFILTKAGGFYLRIYSTLTMTCSQFNNNDDDHFMALCPGLPGWAGTGRNTHPPTTLSSSNLYQLLPSTTIHGILLVQITCLESFCTPSFHVLFGLPLGLEPSTSHNIHFFTQSVSFFGSHSMGPGLQLVGARF